MDETWQNWLFDLENYERHLFSEYDHKNCLEEEFINNGENNSLQSELSWESTTHSPDSNFTTTQSTCALTALAAAANNNNMDTSCWEQNNTGFDYNTTCLKEHASSEKPMLLSSSMSYTLSFEDSTAVPKEAQIEVDNRKSKRGRSSSQIRDHIIAERKRRENLTKMFISLSAIIPGLKKMDKASIINNAIDYVKCLQKRVKELEEQCKKRKIESVVCMKKDKSNGAVVGESSCINRPTKTLLNVEASVSANDVLIRVTCEKRKNIVTKLLAKLETHNLSIVCSNVLPFGNSILNITIIAQVDREEFSMRMDDLVKHLNEDLLECCNLQQ